MLAEGADKLLPTSFVNDRILIKFVRHSPKIVGIWNMFHTKLPFYAQIFWYIVRLWYICLPLYQLPLAEALLSKKTKKGAGMTWTATLKLKLRVQFNEENGWTSPDGIFYPSLCLLSMIVQMQCFWTMGVFSYRGSTVLSKRRFQRVREVLTSHSDEREIH